MLKVTIHHRKNIRRTRSHPLQTSRSQTPAPNPPNKPHPWLGASQLHQNLPRPILRIIINKNNFPIVTRQELFKSIDNKRDIVAFVERGDDDGEFQFSYYR